MRQERTKKMKKIFYDLETTGTNPLTCAVHQIAGFVEIDDEIVETFDIRLRPFEGAEIQQEALDTCGKKLEELMAYPDHTEGYRKFISILERYINKFDKKDKAFLAGYNNRGFDDAFLRIFFERHGDKYFGSWFYPDSLDALVLACEYLQTRRTRMPCFKQWAVAQTLGIPYNKDELHNAVEDVRITRRIYRIVTGRDIEI